MLEVGLCIFFLLHYLHHLILHFFVWVALIPTANNLASPT